MDGPAEWRRLVGGHSQLLEFEDRFRDSSTGRAGGC